MMKKLPFCITVLLLIAGLNGSLSAQPQYYNYNTSGTNNSFPFNISGGKEVQLLYLPGDFSQPSPAPAGNITSVSFLISTSYALGPWTYTDFTIKMGQATLSSFASGGFYTGALTTVYYRASVSLQAAAGTWLTVALDSPFPYDPALSLIIDVGHCGAPGATGYSAQYTNGSGNRRNWSVGGCPFAYYGPNSAVYHAGINVATAGPPTALTGSATSVLPTTATLNGSVNANGATTNVFFDYGLTASYGTTVSGVPPTVSGNSFTPVTAALTGLLPGNTYHYRARAVNSEGSSNGADSTFTTPPDAPLAVTLAAAPVTSTGATLNGTINANGASTMVRFEYGLTAAYGTTVAGVPGTVTGNANTPVSATISGLTTDLWYHYRVYAINVVDTTFGLDTTFFTSSCPMPGVPGPISGPDTACANSLGNVYSVDSISYAVSYLWTVPAGSVITAGANTNSITVTIGTTSGNVTVQGVDTCGNGPIGILPISVVPAPVPTITGPDSMCVNSGYYNYLTEAGMTGYIWTISAGGTITYGQGTNQIQVMWNSSGAQSVSVNYQGQTGCYAGSPTVFPVTVNEVPDPAGTITGTSALCAGSTGVSYSVAPIVNANTYVWTLPAGATIASGDLTPSITVDFALSASSGDITVYGNNICGNGPVSPAFPVTVYAIPPTPVIALSGDTLTSSAPAGNQWYLDGTAIPGATNQIYVATQNGEYWCDVTLNGCQSDTSNHINVVLIGIDPLQAERFSVRPVPNDGRFTVTMNWPEREAFVIQVFNNLGVLVQESDKIPVKGTVEKIIDLRPAPNGIYTVVIRSSEVQIIKKIIVSK